MLAVYTNKKQILGAREFARYSDSLFEFEPDLSMAEVLFKVKQVLEAEPLDEAVLKDLDRVVFLTDPQTSEYQLYVHGKLAAGGILDEEDYDEACNSVFSEIGKANIMDTEIDREKEDSFIVKMAEEEAFEFPAYAVHGYETLLSFLIGICDGAENKTATEKFVSFLTEQEKATLKKRLKESGYSTDSLAEDLYLYEERHWNPEEEYRIVKDLNDDALVWKHWLY